MQKASLPLEGYTLSFWSLSLSLSLSQNIFPKLFYNGIVNEMLENNLKIIKWRTWKLNEEMKSEDDDTISRTKNQARVLRNEFNRLSCLSGLKILTTISSNYIFGRFSNADNGLQTMRSETTKRKFMSKKIEYRQWLDQK